MDEWSHKAGQGMKKLEGQRRWEKYARKCREVSCSDIWASVEKRGKQPWRERKCQKFETVAKEIQARGLSIESPAFYHRTTALHIIKLRRRLYILISMILNVM